MIYLFLTLYLFVLAYFYDFCHRSHGKKFHFWFSYILLVCLLTFRYRVGGDTINYIYHFENTIPDLFQLEFFTNMKLQPIPATIFSFCKTFFDDFTYVQAIFAIFVNAVVFHFLKKHTRYFYTALLLYGLTFFMKLNCEIMRESLAISFFLLAYPFMLKGKYGYYYLITALSVLCHFSAIVTLLFPLLIINRNRSKTLYLLVVFSVVVLVVLSSNQLTSVFFDYTEYYSEYESTFWGKLRIIIFNLLLPYYFLNNSKKWQSIYIKTGVYFYIVCSFISLFFYIAYRFNNYLMVFYIIMVAEYLHHIRQTKVYDLPQFRVVVVSLAFLYSFMGPYFSDVSKYVGHQAKWYCIWYPYYSIFDPQINADRENYIMNRR